MSAANTFYEQTNIKLLLHITIQIYLEYIQANDKPQIIIPILAWTDKFIIITGFVCCLEQEPTFRMACSDVLFNFSVYK